MVGDTAVLCNESIERFSGMATTFYKPFVTTPVAPDYRFHHTVHVPNALYLDA